MSLFDIFPQLGVTPPFKAGFSVYRSAHYTEPFVTSNDVTTPAGKLQDALTNSIKAKAKEPDHHQKLHERLPDDPDFLDFFPMPFTIADVTGTPPYPAAHYNGDEVDFDASEMKVAVLFAAFELRAMVRRYATTFSITTKAQLLKDLRALRPRIVDRVPEIKTKTDVRRRPVRIQDAQLLPDFKRVLTIEDSVTPMKIDFNGAVADEPDKKKKKSTYDFGHSLFDMIVNSGDETARNCIDAIGYAFLNGALEGGGFFERPTLTLDDRTTFRGLWVGGNYAFETIRGVLSVNDGPAQFGGTTRQYARLFALIRAGTFADPNDPGGDLMAFLLHKAQSGAFPPALDFDGAFQYQLNKLGWAPLGKGGPKDSWVGSEVALLQKVKSDGSLGKLYVVAWQNMEVVYQSNKPAPVQERGGHVLYRQSDIVEIITNTVAAYE